MGVILKLVVMIAVVGSLVGSTGCATMKESVLLGIGSGAAGGSIIGATANFEDRGSGAIAGSLVGAVVGGLTSYFIHQGLESRDAEIRKDTLFGLDKFGVQGVPKGSSAVPSVSFRVLEEQRIDTHRKGNRVIEGHRVWVLSDDSSVQLNEGSTKEGSQE